MREIFLSIMYVFRQFAKFISSAHSTTLGGNVDLYYILAIPYFCDIKNRRKRVKEFLFLFSFLFLYAILQICLNVNLNIIKVIVNIVKIVVCYFVLRYTMDNIRKTNLAKIIVTISGMYCVLTVLAVVFSQSSWFWRFNDGVNHFSLTRLQLFYLEPSELGFHLMLVIIALVTIVLRSKKNAIIGVALFFLLTNLITLYLAKPMGAIAIGAVAIVLMVMHEYILNPTRNKLKFYVVLVVIAIICLVILYNMENPLIMRILYTLEGKDSSNNYRVGISLEVFKRSLLDYNFLGCGFGNLNTEAFISNYREIGLTVVVVNSFLYFIIETGVFGLVIVAGLIIAMIGKSVRDKSVLKFGLSMFIIMYSFVGGHFTSAVTWVCYGIIFSNYKDRDLLEDFKKLF